MIIDHSFEEESDLDKVIKMWKSSSIIVQCMFKEVEHLSESDQIKSVLLKLLNERFSSPQTYYFASGPTANEPAQTETFNGVYFSTWT